MRFTTPSRKEVFLDRLKNLYNIPDDENLLEIIYRINTYDYSYELIAPHFKELGFVFLSTIFEENDHALENKNRDILMIEDEDFLPEKIRSKIINVYAIPEWNSDKYLPKLYTYPKYNSKNGIKSIKEFLDNLTEKEDIYIYSRDYINNSSVFVTRGILLEDFFDIFFKYDYSIDQLKRYFPTKIDYSINKLLVERKVEEILKRH